MKLRGRDTSHGLLGGARRAVIAHPDLAALALVLLLGAALRVAFLPRAPVFLHGDSYQYYRPAYALFTSEQPLQTLLRGDDSQLPLKRPPAYPVFLALVDWTLGEDLYALAAVQHLLGLGTVALSYGIGRLAAGRWAGLVGGLAAALSGGLLVYEQYLLTEGPFAFLTALGLFLYLVGLRGNSWWAYAGSGLAIGMATLTRVHAQILLLIAPVIVLLLYRRWCAPVRGTLIALAVAAVVLAPWMYRNHLVHGDFTVAARSGQSLIYMALVHRPGTFVFYDRENPPQDDDDRLERARKYIQAQDDLKARNPRANVLGITIHAWLMKNLDLSEAEANAIMTRVALDAVRARPLTYLGVLIAETREFLVGRPEDLAKHWDDHRQLLADRDNQPPRRLRALAAPPTPEQDAGFALAARLTNLYQSAWLGPLVPALFVLGMLGALVVPAWRLTLVPGLAVAAMHGVTIAVVGFNERYRHPVDPLVHVVAVVGVLLLLRLAGSALARPRRPAAEPAAATGEPGLAPH